MCVYLVRDNKCGMQVRGGVQCNTFVLRAECCAVGTVRVQW